MKMNMKKITVAVLGVAMMSSVCAADANAAVIAYNHQKPAVMKQNHNQRHVTVKKNHNQRPVVVQHNYNQRPVVVQHNYNQRPVVVQHTTNQRPVIVKQQGYDTGTIITAGILGTVAGIAIGVVASR